MTNCQGKILAIDDEPIILDLIKLNLECEGYSVDVCRSAEEALSRSLSVYDIILTDVMMEEMSGVEFANKVKQNPATSHIPIIICSAKGMECDVVDGLSSGADDYIIKPFSMRELVARVRSILRRNAPASTSKENSAISHFSLVPSRGNVIIDDEEVLLTPTEYQLLELFINNPNRFFSRDEIFQLVWKGQIVSARTVDVNISRLRHKLGNYASYIENRSGFGYGFSE